MLALSLAAIPDIQAKPLATVPVVLQGSDTFGGTLTYQVGSADTNAVQVTLTSAANPVVKMSVAGYGDMTFFLYQDAIPDAVSQFLKRVTDHTYDGKQFYRVEPGFVIQGGVDGAGAGDKFDDQFLAGTSTSAEIPNLRFTTKGVLAMANSGPDTNNSEFFITDSASRVLDFRYTIIGELIGGESVRAAIQAAPVTYDTVQGRNEPTTPITITSVNVVSGSQSDVLLVSVPKLPSNPQPVTVTVIASNGKDAAVTQTFKVTPVAETDIYANAPPFVPSVNFQMPTNSTASYNFPYVDADISEENTGRNADATLVNPPASLSLSVSNTAVLTLTASNGLCGIFGLKLSISEDTGNAGTNRAADTQVVPVVIYPLAPTSITLLTPPNSNNLSDNNNSAGQELKFRVAGVVAGNTVNVYSDGTLIGTAIVDVGQTSVDVTTNGTTVLSDGKHTITARQVFEAKNVVVGNFKSDSQPLTSSVSTGLQIGVHMGTGVGLYDPTTGTFYLTTRKVTGTAEISFKYGALNAGWLAIAGDWDGDGKDSVGLYDPKTSAFYLRNTNTTGVADVTFGFGAPNAGWKPVVGDWDGDGKDSPALYDPAHGVLYTQNSNVTTAMAHVIYYGDALPGALPLGGHWAASAKADGLGLFYANTSQFALRNGVTDNTWAAQFGYGTPNANLKPLASDWDQTNGMSVGVYDPATSAFYLRDANNSGYATYTFAFGAAGANWQPVAGLWNGALAAALTVEGGVDATQTGATALTADQLQPMLDAAVARWTAAGAPAEAVYRMAHTQIRSGDLPSGQLAEANGIIITIDATAAGYGWFVDGTPAADEEFATDASGKGLSALDARAAAKIDLLTVVEHELGHIAGLQDLAVDAHDLMSASLGSGLRRTPSQADVDAVFSLG